jgi:hypothetical protein
MIPNQDSQEAISHRRRVKQLRKTIITLTLLLVPAILMTRHAILAERDVIREQMNFSARLTPTARREATAIARQVQNVEAQNESLRLAEEANGNLQEPDGNPETAALLAIRALNTAYSPQADGALVQAVDKLGTWQGSIGHTDQVVSVAFSPDGQTILTGSADHTARLWDVATGEKIRVFTGHTSSVNSVDFSPDGHWILTGSDDNTARIWETDWREFVEYACTRVFWDLTADERAQYGITDDTPTCPQSAEEGR